MRLIMRFDAPAHAESASDKGPRKFPLTFITDGIWKRPMAIAIRGAHSLHVAEATTAVADEFNTGDSVRIEEARDLKFAIASVFLGCLAQFIVVERHRCAIPR